MDFIDHLVIAQERAEKRFVDQRLNGLNNSRVISATQCIDCSSCCKKRTLSILQYIQFRFPYII